MRNTEPLAEVDESGGFERTRVGGETQSPCALSAEMRLNRVAGAGGAYNRVCPTGAQVVPAWKSVRTPASSPK